MRAAGYRKWMCRHEAHMYPLTLSSFGWPLVIGGVIKGVYDILLLIKFQKVRPPEEAAVLSAQ